MNIFYIGIPLGMKQHIECGVRGEEESVRGNTQRVSQMGIVEQLSYIDSKKLLKRAFNREVEMEPKNLPANHWGSWFKEPGGQ